MDHERCELRVHTDVITYGESRIIYQAGTRIDRGEDFQVQPSKAVATAECETCGIYSQMTGEGNLGGGATNDIAQQIIKLREGKCEIYQAYVVAPKSPLKPPTKRLPLHRGK